MTPEEWGAAPWYYTEALKEGLRAQGILVNPDSSENPNRHTTTPAQPGKSSKPVVVDFTDGSPLPGGFSQRSNSYN